MLELQSINCTGFVREVAGDLSKALPGLLSPASTLTTGDKVHKELDQMEKHRLDIRPAGDRNTNELNNNWWWFTVC